VRASRRAGIRAQLDDASVSSIVAVLEYAKSSYLAPFLSLRNLIHREAVAAEDNLKFLLCLEEPCQQLAAAHPQVGHGGARTAWLAPRRRLRSQEERMAASSCGRAELGRAPAWS
jgi:hypothetical protein